MGVMVMVTMDMVIMATEAMDTMAMEMVMDMAIMDMVTMAMEAMDTMAMERGLLLPNLAMDMVMDMVTMDMEAMDMDMATMDTMDNIYRRSIFQIFYHCS